MPVNPTPVIFRFINNRYRRLFWIFFTTAVIAGYLQTLDNQHLSNRAAPNGIVSFELEASHAGDTSIIQSWKAIAGDAVVAAVDCPTEKKRDLLSVAVKIIWIDFVFIPLYVMLLIVTIAWIR